MLMSIYGDCPKGPAMKNYTAELFSSEKYKLAESPFYDPRTQTLSWVDIPEGKFYTQQLGQGSPSAPRIYNLGQAIGSAVPAQKEGSYIIAGTTGLFKVDGPIAPTSSAGTTEQSPKLIRSLTEYYESYQRSNDAKADPAGRLWFGSSVDDDIHEASGNLFCLDPLDGGKITCRQPDTKISNGMAWSHDHKKFYFSDSLQYAVFSYDYDLATGTLSNRQVLFQAQEGVTDGLCIDSEDNLWVAFWGGSRIEHRSGKDGTLLGSISVDAKKVTSCCFMGTQLDTLFITTSGNGQSGPHDGCLFTCKVDVKGCGCDYCKL